jgi:DNA-binding NtrC family response regulator
MTTFCVPEPVGSLRKPEAVAPVSPGVADVLTVGVEPALRRSIDQIFRRVGWTIVHAEDVESSADYLRENVAAVAIVDSETTGSMWRNVVAELRSAAAAPKVIVTARDRSCLDEVIENGGYEVMQKPLRKADTLWTVASAWHHWMTQYEESLRGYT